MSKISLAVEVASLSLRNPTMNAAGILGISSPLLKRVYDGGAGAVVTKSLGLNPRIGHVNPTLVYVESGVLNAMGLPNPGADYFIESLRELKKDGVPVIASFFGESIDEFREVAKILTEGRADALELNCSCPNVEGDMGMLGSDPKNTEKVTSAVKEVAESPVFVKLSPNVKDICDTARAAEIGGADGITAVNTLKGIAIDIERKRPILSNVFGGLSGPALKNVALRCVWDIYEVVEIPIIGCGGIKDWRDAIEFVLCGSTAVQIGTAIMNSGFEIYKEVSEGIFRYLEINGFNSLREIVGLAHET